MAGSIVVGADGSSCAKAALNEAIDLAKQTGDEVVVVFGYEPYRGAAEIQDHRAALEELGEKIGGEALAHVQDSGVAGSLELVDREAADALIAVADEHDSRMIVVGSYGDSPWKGALLGSTPHKLVQLARRPVLVVHTAD
ncbi:MAG: universal stress protein [Actinobacteria bacterium]|nr:universal stress protein [Actinomycetota bacterium]